MPWPWGSSGLADYSCVSFFFFFFVVCPLLSWACASSSPPPPLLRAGEEKKLKHPKNWNHLFSPTSSLFVLSIVSSSFTVGSFSFSLVPVLLWQQQQLPDYQAVCQPMLSKKKTFKILLSFSFDGVLCHLSLFSSRSFVKKKGGGEKEEGIKRRCWWKEKWRWGASDWWNEQEQARRGSFEIKKGKWDQEKSFDFLLKLLLLLLLSQVRKNSHANMKGASFFLKKKEKKENIHIRPCLLERKDHLAAKFSVYLHTCVLVVFSRCFLFLTCRQAASATPLLVTLRKVAFQGGLLGWEESGGAMLPLQPKLKRR